MQCTDNPAGWVLQQGLKSLLLKLCILLVSTLVNFHLFVSTEIITSKDAQGRCKPTMKRLQNRCIGNDGEPI